MSELRYDVEPLPIVELAPIRVTSADPDEPFVLGGGQPRVSGSSRLAVTALRRPGGVLTAATDVAGQAVITPSGTVRTAHIDDVLIIERIAAVTRPAGGIFQWTVDRDVDLVIDGLGTCSFVAGDTATLLALAPGVSGGAVDAARAFRASATEVARAIGAGLHVEAPESVGNALAWAKARLFAYAEAQTDIRLPTTLAALVAGQFDRARRDLDQAPDDLLPLLAARYAAWTGDVHGLSQLRARLRDATDTLQRRPPADDTVGAIRMAGLAELELTAMDFGDPAYAADLYAAAKRARLDAARPPGHETAAVLAALRVLDPRVPLPAPPGSGDVAFHGWLTWAALEEGRLSDGLTGWASLIAASDTPVRGAWPHSFGDTDDDPVSTALFVTTLAHGVLGLEPDAPRHRLRIRPRLSADPADFRVTGIRCGDATVTLEIVVDDISVTLRLRQDEGAIPITALLEPCVAGPIARTTVDGSAAALDVRPHGEALIVPVQLVLDDERTVRIERGTG